MPLAIVGWIVTALTVVFKNRIGQLILAGLVWAGLSYGATKIVVQPVIDQIWLYLDGLGSAGGEFGAFAVAALGILKIDVALTMIVSAVMIRVGVTAAKVHMTRAVGRGTGY